MFKVDWKIIWTIKWIGQLIPLFLIGTLHLVSYCYWIKLRYYQWDFVNKFYITYFEKITSKLHRCSILRNV